MTPIPLVPLVPLVQNKFEGHFRKAMYRTAKSKC